MSSDHPDSHAENKWKEDLRNAGITGAASGTVDQYGSAIKEHFVAFSGHDYETGQPLTKGLKDIAGSKVNFTTCGRVGVIYNPGLATAPLAYFLGEVYAYKGLSQI